MQEFEVLKHIFAANRELPPNVTIPPGDDMAEIRLGGRDLLIAVDQLVAGRHVDLTRVGLAAAGRKAVARCVSDVAAMAGRPIAALVAATLPPEFDAVDAARLFDAMRAAAADLGCPLIGGDLAVHGAPGQAMTCAVTVLAEPTPAGAVRRAGALAGDGVYVTGVVGGAWDDPEAPHHLTFEPRVEAALALRARLGDRLHAMIDLSDGLGRDGAHVARASNVRLVLDAARIPRRRPDLDWRRAVGDGEDYELLFTAVGDVPDRIADEVPVTRIGNVTPAEGEAGVIVHADGRSWPADDLGWQHGASEC